MCSCGSFWIYRLPVIHSRSRLGRATRRWTFDHSTRLRTKTGCRLQACSTKRLIWDAGLMNDRGVRSRKVKVTRPSYVTRFSKLFLSQWCNSHPVYSHIDGSRRWPSPLIGREAAVHGRCCPVDEAVYPARELWALFGRSSGPSHQT